MKKSNSSWCHRQRGESSWGFVIVLLLLSVMLILWGMADRQALPDERAWAQNEVQKLALSAEQKKSFQADIAVARDKGEVQSAVWKARWFGDQAYREQVQREEAERQAYVKAHENDFDYKLMGFLQKHLVWFVALPLIIFLPWIVFRRFMYSY